MTSFHIWFSSEISEIGFNIRYLAWIGQTLWPTEVLTSKDLYPRMCIIPLLTTPLPMEEECTIHIRACTIKFFTIWSSRMHARTTYHLLGFYSQEEYTSVEDPINYAIRKWVHPRSQIWSPLIHERHEIVQAVWQTPKWFPWVSRYGMNLLRSCQLQIKLESDGITWANVTFTLDFNKKFSRWSMNIKVENTKGKYHVWEFRFK